HVRAVARERSQVAARDGGAGRLARQQRAQHRRRQRRHLAQAAARGVGVCRLAAREGRELARDALLGWRRAGGDGGGIGGGRGGGGGGGGEALAQERRQAARVGEPRLGGGQLGG